MRRAEATVVVAVDIERVGRALRIGLRLQRAAEVHVHRTAHAIAGLDGDTELQSPTSTGEHRAPDVATRIERRSRTGLRVGPQTEQRPIGYAAVRDRERAIDVRGAVGAGGARA